MAQEQLELSMFAMKYDYIDKLMACIHERTKALTILDKAYSQANSSTFIGQMFTFIKGSNTHQDDYQNIKNNLLNAESNVYLQYFLDLISGHELHLETSYAHLFIKNLILEIPGYKHELKISHLVLKVAEALKHSLKKNLLHVAELKTEPEKSVTKLQPHLQQIKLVEGSWVSEKEDHERIIYHIDFSQKNPVLTLVTEGITHNQTLSHDLKSFFEKNKIVGLEQLKPQVFNNLKALCFQNSINTLQSIKVWVEKEHLRSLDELTQKLLKSMNNTVPLKTELRTAFILNLSSHQLEWVDSLGHLLVIPLNEKVGIYVRNLMDKINKGESFGEIEVLKLRLALNQVQTAKTVSLEKKNTIESALSGQFLSKKTSITRVHLEPCDQVGQIAATMSPTQLAKGQFKSSFVLMPNLEKLYWVNTKNSASELNLRNYSELYSWLLTKPNFSKEVNLQELKQHLARINVNSPEFPEIKNPSALKVHLVDTNNEDERISVLYERVATGTCQSSFVLMPVLKKLYWINTENKVFELCMNNHPELESWFMKNPDFSQAGNLYQLKQHLSKINLNSSALSEIIISTLPTKEEKALEQKLTPKSQAASFLAAQRKINNFFLDKNLEKQNTVVSPSSNNQRLA